MLRRHVTLTLLSASLLAFFPAGSVSHASSLYSPVLLKDIDAGAAGSEPLLFTVAGGTLYFGADDGHGTALWRSDGTATGTREVAPVAPTIAMIAVGSGIYFFGNDGAHGLQLWRSDGTSAGTTMLTDPSDGIAGFSELVAAGARMDVVFFTADGQLWVSRGTAVSTVRLTPAEWQLTSVSGLTAAGGTLFFAAVHLGESELWTSEGTTDSTTMTLGAMAGVSQLAGVGSSLFCSGDDGVHGSELWWWPRDGIFGRGMVKDIALGAAGSSPEQITAWGPWVLFTADDGASGRELWRSDATAWGTYLVDDIRAGATGSDPAEMRNVGGSMIYFSADDGVHGRELWRSNGNPGDTVMVRDIRPGPDGSNPYEPTEVGNTVFFVADDGVHGGELWATNPATGSTAMVGDIHAGSTGSWPYYLTNLGGTLVFAADDGVHGVELWKLAAVTPPAPTIAGFSPSSGLPGATVTVSGTNLAGASAVTLGGANVDFAVASDTQLTFTVSALAPSGKVAVTTPGGTATSSGTFVVVATPQIEGFSPHEGGARTTVTVNGTHFTGTTRVQLGATSAPFSVVSDTRLTFTVPAGSAEGTITVTNPAGADTSAETFDVLDPPSITSFAPTSGPVGTPVIVTGDNLGGTVGVRLGSVVSVPTAVTGETQVTFTVPPGATSGPIQLLTTSGAAASAGIFAVTP